MHKFVYIFNCCYIYIGFLCLKSCPKQKQGLGLGLGLGLDVCVCVCVCVTATCDFLCRGVITCACTPSHPSPTIFFLTRVVLVVGGWYGMDYG